VARIRRRTPIVVSNAIAQTVAMYPEAQSPLPPTTSTSQAATSVVRPPPTAAVNWYANPAPL
jgi:hypothetical protein